MTTNAEFDWETKGSKLTPRQRADFSEVVDNWLTGAVPLAEAAAARELLAVLDKLRWIHDFTRDVARSRAAAAHS